MTHHGVWARLPEQDILVSQSGRGRLQKMEALIRAHRLLCSRFVSEELFRAAIGGPRADVNAVAAYLRLPVAERPNVSLFFDPEYYNAIGPAPLPADEDRLLHFLDTGIVELRAPHPLIDLRFIVSRNPLLIGEIPSPDGLMDLLDYDLSDPSPYFSVDFYASQFGAIAGPTPDAGLLRHFLTQGAQAGRRPNAWLDPGWYRSQHDDVPQDAWQAVRHFILYGDREGRNPGPDFDAAHYRHRYPDAVISGIPPLLHFLAYGTPDRETAPDRAVTTIARLRPTGHAMPTDAALLWAEDARMREGVAEARQRRKDWAHVAPPTLIQSCDNAADLAALRFAKPRKPRVSVLIPAFNECAITLECLMALAAANLSAGVEIVLADDASTEPAMAKFARVPGLVVLRHAENLGFLASCNAAFAKCRGEYVLLLNNDTQIMPTAIAAMVEALDADAGLGAVGAKLIYPNGRLQEAGCYIRPNGSTGMVGLFADPAEAGYNRDRDVAYCSGAALMLRRALVEGPLFDPAFRPAYCEDVDLCLRLRAAGHRIGYVHRAVVVHHLSISTGRESETLRQQTAMRNQQRLTERWGDTLREMDRVRVLAFFLPQFHPTPENDLWWGRGFTEWTNVARAQPSHAGHYQPHLPADLGFYDLRLPETLHAQAALARRYGVEGFVIYHYNFGERRMLHRPLDVLLANPDIDINFCLCWANENWTRHWDGGAREILLEQRYDDATLNAVIADAVRTACDARAITVAGKPLFLVYRPLSIPNPQEFATACRTAFAAAGFPGVYLAYVESMEVVDVEITPAQLGFDACVEFPPHRRAEPQTAAVEVIKLGWAGYRYNYTRTAQNYITRETAPFQRHPAVFPSWDNTPRQPRHGSSFDDASPEAFRVYVEEKIEEIRAFQMGEERLLFVNAWNEWAEGAHLEPDSGYGHRWLEALHAALLRQAFA